MKRKRSLLCIAFALVIILLFGCSLPTKRNESDQAVSGFSDTAENPNDGNQTAVDNTFDDTAAPESGDDTAALEESAEAKVLQNANALMSQGDYSQAYHVLSDAIIEYGELPDLVSALSDCEQNYILDTLTRAENKFNENKDYEAAIDILMLSQVDLPEASELQTAIELYQSYRPTRLNEMESFYEDHADDARGSWFKGFGSYSDNKITDNCENEYQGYWEGLGGGLTVYRVNGKYARMTGVIFTPSKAKNVDDLGYVSICGNGRELWNSGKVGKGIEPVSFDIDLTGITELTVKSYYGECSDYSPYLADIWLYPEL